MDNFSTLAARVSGPVLTPSDEGFAAEVLGHNLAFTHRPDVAVGAANAADVVEAVRFAAAHSLPVRVLSTGHGDHAPIIGGMLIITKRLDAVAIDPETRLATIGAGVAWGQVHDAAGPLGLTPVSGSSATVGVVGYTLGGGLGPLARSHGFTSDYVRSFSVVTAAGELVRASASEHPELFWALRGGKGGLGIVTELELELLPLATVYAGAMFFDTEHIEAVLHGWIEWTATAHDEVTTSVAIINFPPIEQVPEIFRGKQLLTLRFAYPGDPGEGQRLAAPLRSLAPSLLDTVDVLPTSLMRLIHTDPEDSGPSWSSGLLLGELDQGFAETLLSTVGPAGAAPIIAVELRHLGAATATDVAGTSAVGGRDSAFTLTVVGAPVPALFAEVIPAFHGGLVRSIEEWVSPETTINFAGEVHDREAFESAWPAPIFERLEAVRALYDPAALFTYGPPAG